MDNGLAEVALEAAKVEIAKKEQQLWKAANSGGPPTSRPAGFRKRDPVCSKRTEDVVSDCSKPPEAPPAKRVKQEPKPLDQPIKREPVDQPPVIKKEPVDQPIKREPSQREPLDQPIQREPLDQPLQRGSVERELGVDPINTRSKQAPLEKPIKREPDDERIGGVPVKKEPSCAQGKPNSLGQVKESRAKSLEGQADANTSESLPDQEKPSLLKSAEVLSPAEQQALVQGKATKPRVGEGKGKAKPDEDGEGAETSGNEASHAEPKRGPGRVPCMDLSIDQAVTAQVFPFWMLASTAATMMTAEVSFGSMVEM
ncbi:unnamed protein product [Symbiodinium sp. KB8]|nr:unnamed protein product [Symbiodinium sp. KB8]